MPTPFSSLPLPALVERLAGVLAPYLVRCEPATGSREDQARFVARAVAREALAFVAALLPTRETWGRVLYHLDCPDGDPVECPHWESELYAEEREDFMRKADALLRELRERLGMTAVIRKTGRGRGSGA